MFRWSQIPHADETQRLTEIDVRAPALRFVHIDGMICADLTARHIYILGSPFVAKDDAPQELFLAYQNISLRQSRYTAPVDTSDAMTTTRTNP